MMTLRFLLLDDNPRNASVIKATLLSSNIDCELLRVETRSNFVTALDNNEFDLILANYALRDFDGLSALEIARDKCPEVPFIFVSDSLGEELAIETLLMGATDYVLNSRLERLVPSVERALREAKERRERKRVSLMLVEQKRLLELIALGRPMDECLKAVCASISLLSKSTRACFLLPDAKRPTFQRFITPDLAPSFGQGLKDAPINDLCIGTCGEAVYNGQPVTCADIVNDERWSIGWRNLCVAHGILACHSAPVLGVDGLPLGSLMLCFDKARQPTDWEYQLANFGAQVASIVFERDRSNEALRQNEARLRTVAANLPNAAVFIVDRDLRYLLAEGQALSGASIISSDLVGKTIWEALPPNLVAHHEHYYRQALSGEPFSLEHCSHDQYYVSHSTPLYNERGEIDAVLVVSYNITERKRAELNAEFLATVSQDLVAATSVDEIVQTIGSQLNRYLNTSYCAFVEINEGAQQAVINHDWHQNDVPSLVGVYSLLEFVTDEFLQIAQSGQPIVVRDVTIDPRIADPSRYAALKIGAEINVPLIRDGKWKFSLTVLHQAPYNWRSDEIELMRELANRVWAKLERARAEAALRHSESRFRLMVESAKEYAIFTLDLNGIITSWNSGAERVLGYTEAEALGSYGHIIFTPEDKKKGRVEWEMQTALTQGRVENERWHIRKDGSRFWASGLMMPLLSLAGNAEGFVNILQDKTAQRQASERLQLLYETTRDLLATPQPMQLMSNLFSKLSERLELDYYHNYMVEKKDNQLMLHLKNYEGISFEAASSIEWIEFGQYLCGLVATERRQIILDNEQISTHPNAQLICSMGITAYAGQPLIVHGQLLGTLSFASRKRTSFTPEEIDLLQSTCEQIAIAIERANLSASIQQQAEQLQQANRIKDEFLAVLSHELRSPLNPILGWSKLLQTGKLDAAKTAQGLTVIERNALLQSELIEDLLDVSRILQGKLSLKVGPVDLAPTIQAAMETVHLAAQAKSIEINAFLEPNVGQVSGDPNRLQQIIWNLLSNAVKFTDVGGRVEIELRRLGMSAQITVSDNGKGIHPDFLPHVFDYFRQEDGTTTRRFGGLGLGLAIVRHLVELHGGTVEADSPGEGQGATFTVRLPLISNPSIQNPDSTPSDLCLDLHGIKVLIVDDDTDTREFIAFMLEMYGASVTAAASGVEALTIFNQDRPDVLVSDIGMSDMDGYMLMQQLRTLSLEQGELLPAIALTAYAGEINQQQALQAGFQTHITKPVEPSELIVAITNLVGSRFKTNKVNV